jgi:hypothetical protein
MYLDAIINANDPREVVYNSTPENVKRLLENRSEEENKLVVVYDGETLRRWTVKEYLAR